MILYLALLLQQKAAREVLLLVDLQALIQVEMVVLEVALELIMVLLLILQAALAILR
jgi:hypothetical protein